MLASVSVKITPGKPKLSMYIHSYRVNLAYQRADLSVASRIIIMCVTFAISAAQLKYSVCVIPHSRYSIIADSLAGVYVCSYYIGIDSEIHRSAERAEIASE